MFSADLFLAALLLYPVELLSNVRHYYFKKFDLSQALCVATWFFPPSLGQLPKNMPRLIVSFYVYCSTGKINHCCNNI